MFTVHLNSNKGDVINCYGIVLLCDMLILIVFFTTQCVSVCTSYTSFFIILKPFANLMNHCISSFSRPSFQPLLITQLAAYIVLVHSCRYYSENSNLKGNSLINSFQVDIYMQYIIINLCYQSQYFQCVHAR